MQWTSLEAYAEIYDDLPRRRKQVLKHLLEYVVKYGDYPTGQELAVFIEEGYYDPGSNTPGCAKRLTELADEHNAIHRHGIRRCKATGHKALTWAPGPRPYSRLGDPVISPRLASRLQWARQHIPGLYPAQAAWLLGTPERLIKKAWNGSTQETLSHFSGG